MKTVLVLIGGWILIIAAAIALWAGGRFFINWVDLELQIMEAAAEDLAKARHEAKIRSKICAHSAKLCDDYESQGLGK